MLHNKKLKKLMKSCLKIIIQINAKIDNKNTMIFNRHIIVSIAKIKETNTIIT